MCVPNPCGRIGLVQSDGSEEMMLGTHSLLKQIGVRTVRASSRPVEVGVRINVNEAHGVRIILLED